MDGVSITIPRGEFVCVIGPSGHGKSTLMNLVAGFITPDEGVISAHGEPVTGPGPDRGMLFQADTLFNWMKVRRNVEFGLRARGLPKSERKRIVDNLLHAVGLTEYGDAWPKQLSGGMRRRAAIAAVFANEPEVLLMDEPFTGLDFARRNVIYGVLLDLWRRVNNTVLCITHDLDEALTIATRVIVVVRGRVALDEPLDMPYPRTPEMLAAPELVDLRVRVLDHLENAVGDTVGSAR
ncbi:ABC transporter ATP-binding protein [Gordonia westfalica]|uniref:ABC transporter ATP-binding protein n=1 Tax=Gordonia westfalica TaxID=158898 RepID=UPI001AD7F15E|nr:ATP-binding cassette domain-containing protein [Gordonia westfalica]